VSRESRVAGHEIPPEWGAVYDGRTLSLSISLPPTGTALTVNRIRAGRTVLDLRARARPERVVVQIGVRFGPPLPIHLELSGPWEVQQVLVDENAVDGRSAALVASHEHEVQFLVTRDS